MKRVSIVYQGSVIGMTSEISKDGITSYPHLKVPTGKDWALLNIGIDKGQVYAIFVRDEKSLVG